MFTTPAAIISSLPTMQEGFESCDELETNDCLEANGTCEEETPCDGMSFGSEKEITEYYNNYDERVGFGVKKISSKKGDEGVFYFNKEIK